MKKIIKETMKQERAEPKAMQKGKMVAPKKPMKNYTKKK
jgi:hypothetical protein